MDKSAQSNTLPFRRGFTLTELLVVIAIIAVLAALVSVGVMRALDSAKQTRIKVEVDNLDAAFKSYKEKYGSYPPTDLRNPMTNQPLRAHIARAFPRYNLNNLPLDLPAAGIDVNNYRPDQALVFWLRGFGPDPTAPFVTTNDLQLNGGTPGTKVVRSQFLDFDQSRIIGSTTTVLGVYVPPGSKSDVTNSAPYLYFDSAIYGTPAVPGGMAAVPLAFSSAIFTSAGTAVPYWNDVNGNNKSNDATDITDSWVNPDSFQIISAGMDAKYGDAGATAERLYKTGRGYSTSGLDDDNVTNFCAKARLGDDKP